MNSVIVVTPFAYDAELASRLERIEHEVGEAVGGLVVTDGHTRVYLRRDDWIRDSLEPAQLAAFTASIPDPVFYAFDYSDIRLCRRVLEVVADDPRIFVDNDHGVVLPGPAFIELLRRRPDWDWRRDLPPGHDR